MPVAKHSQNVVNALARIDAVEGDGSSATRRDPRTVEKLGAEVAGPGNVYPKLDNRQTRIAVRQLKIAGIGEGALGCYARQRNGDEQGQSWDESASEHGFSSLSRV